jgi:hydrophobic/amphiphilic exporter-1 (mainly G- bacteria), HAE1 family
MLLLRREIFPEFELDILMVSVPYPGASPEEVEEGICQKLEEAVRSSTGSSGRRRSPRKDWATLSWSSNRAERPEIAQRSTLRSGRDSDLSRVGRETGSAGTDVPHSGHSRGRRDGRFGRPRRPQWRLRQVAERIRDDLLMLPGLASGHPGSQGLPDRRRDPGGQLRRYSLTLQQVAQTIRRQNVELPGGTMMTSGQDSPAAGQNTGSTRATKSLDSRCCTIPAVT